MKETQQGNKLYLLCCTPKCTDITLTPHDVPTYRNGERVTSDGTYAISISDYRDGWLTLSLLIPSVSRSQ